jgi:hypothetical protein
MDAPEPGQGAPQGRSDDEPQSTQPPEEEDLLAAMQAARETGEEPAAPAEPAAKGPGASEKPDGAPSEPKGRRRTAILTGLVLLIALAVIALFVFPGVLRPGAAATPGAAASANPTGSAFSSESAGASGVIAASVSPSASPLPTPSPSLPPQTAPMAQVTFNELVLYPSLTAARRPATFTFVSDGPGLVSASIVASAPRDSSTICLSGDGGTPVCGSGATPTASFASQSIQSKWTVTVGSANEDSPTVDVQITWPSNKASITVTQVPFEGHPNRDSLRSLTATITARAAGSVNLAASWGPASLATSLTVWLVDKNGQQIVDQKSYPAAESLPASTAIAVKAGATYRMTLANESSGSTTNPNLSATLQLP